MKNKYLIYLAGPITGLSYEGCTDWREDVIIGFEVGTSHIQGVSPMRTKQYLTGETTIGDSYEQHIMSSQRGIFARDTWDVRRCDALLVNLLGATRVSIGTVMEIAQAKELNKPIVLVMEKGNIHDHAMLREACPFITDDLDVGVDVIMSLFSK